MQVLMSGGPCVGGLWCAWPVSEAVCWGVVLGSLAVCGGATCRLWVLAIWVCGIVAFAGMPWDVASLGNSHALRVWFCFIGRLAYSCSPVQYTCATLSCMSCLRLCIITAQSTISMRHCLYQNTPSLQPFFEGSRPSWPFFIEMGRGRSHKAQELQNGWTGWWGMVLRPRPGQG